MSTVLDHPTSLFDTPPTPTGKLPAWFEERRQLAWQRYLNTQAPRRGDETWRFSSIKQLDFTGFSRREASQVDALVARSSSLATPIARFVFANDTLVHQESSLPSGVVCLPLAEALASHGDLVRTHFMRRDTRLGSAKWTAFHEAHVSSGLFVHVPDHLKIEGTIEVFHWLSGSHSLILPHTLIVTGTQAAVRVIDYFQSADDSSPGLCIAFNDLIAGQSSKLDYLAIQDFNTHTRTIQVNETSVDRDASATGFILNTGSSWARNESLSRLEGEGSRSDMLSVSVPAGSQEYDQRTFQHHVSPGAASDLLYKNSLYDQARTIFSGLIFVDAGAHRTDAYQTCRNLFMSDEAEANSMPGLEINADDVKCSHGSTSAQISEEEIFYLRARGIDPVRARQLIARGFSVEVIERLGDQDTETVALRFLDAKFSRIASGGA